MWVLEIIACCLGVLFIFVLIYSIKKIDKPISKFYLSFFGLTAFFDFGIIPFCPSNKLKFLKQLIPGINPLSFIGIAGVIFMLITLSLALLVTVPMVMKWLRTGFWGTGGDEKSTSFYKK